jgi:uncharacterized protein
MKTKIDMQKIKEFALNEIKKNDIIHNHEHIYCTVRLAKYLAEKEGADVDICEAAAWLHDIAKNKGKNHGIEGAKKAEEFLKILDLNPKIIERICNAIKYHDTSDSKTIEDKVLYDADKLQGVGCYGFLRAFGSDLFANPDRSLSATLKHTEEIQRFFWKTMYTKTAKDMVKKSFGLMDKFYKECEEFSKWVKQ